MPTTTVSTTNRSRGKNRSYEERIAELESKIAEQKQKLHERKTRAKQRQELSPVAKEIPKVAKRLQAFAQLAIDSGRQDISNSVSLFLAGLHRVHQEELDAKRGPQIVEEVDEDEFAEEYGRVRATGRKSG